MLKFILYMLLAVIILSGGIFKTFAINYGISNTSQKSHIRAILNSKKLRYIL